MVAGIASREHPSCDVDSVSDLETVYCHDEPATLVITVKIEVLIQICCAWYGSAGAVCCPHE